MISRRGFLGLLGGLAAAEVARKVYVFAPPGGWSFKGGVIAPGETMFYLPAEHWLHLGSRLRDGEPCSHPGCLSHVSHPCEGCGRVGGRSGRHE